MRDSKARRQRPNAEQRATSLKERIYVTFSSLAIVLVLSTHADETTPGGAAVTLTISVVGTLLAVFAADILSHLTVHAHVPSGVEFRQMIVVSIGSIGVVVFPLGFLLLAGLGIWSTASALQAAIFILLATLVVVGYLAVRRIALPFWQKLIVLLGEVVLGGVVITLQLVSHSR